MQKSIDSFIKLERKKLFFLFLFLNKNITIYE